MKKIILVLAVLMLAAPAFGAAVTITAAQEGSTKEVTISYGTSGQLPRAFALDITVDNGKIIEDVTKFFVGECNDTNGYGIFPASFAREIDADDPNWADVNYTPVADVNDLPGGTEGGKGTPGVTIEMGSLYDASKGKGPPESSGTLCSIWVSGDCNVSFSVNVGRAGVVMEDGNDANSPPHSLVLNGTHVTLEEICIVPDVVDTAEAAAITNIEGEGFVAGTPTYVCSDSIAAGNVISTTPAAGAEPGCGTTVDIVVSEAHLTAPDVVAMPFGGAISTIQGAGLVESVCFESSATVSLGDIISQSPGAGAQVACDLTVLIKVSSGPIGAPACPWDVDGNGFVNKTDRGKITTYLTSFAAPPFWSVACAPGTPEDVDENGFVNKTDRGLITTYLNTLAGPPFWSVAACPTCP